MRCVYAELAGIRTRWGVYRRVDGGFVSESYGCMYGMETFSHDSSRIPLDWPRAACRMVAGIRTRRPRRTRTSVVTRPSDDDENDAEETRAR